MLKIITLSGLDGSGKSTQIELLKSYLKSRDKSFYYFHAVEFSIANIGVRHLKNRRCRTPTGEKSVIKANWIEIQLRKIALLIDICRFKRLAKKQKVDYIISDRYFYDSVVNILFLSCHSRESGNPENTKTGSRIKCGMTKWIEKYIPKPDFAFYIDVKPEVIMQRERKPDQGMDYLIAKDKLFSDKIKDWNMIILNGEKHKEEIFHDLRLNLSRG